MRTKNIRSWGWTGSFILVALSLMVASVLPAILFNGCAGIQAQAPQYKTLSIPFTDGTYLNFKVPSDMPDFMQFEQSFGMQLTSYALVIAYYAPGTPSMGGIGTKSYVFIDEDGIYVDGIPILASKDALAAKLVDFYSEQPAVIVLSHFKQLATDNNSSENIMELEQRDNVDGFDNILHVMEGQ